MLQFEAPSIVLELPSKHGVHFNACLVYEIVDDAVEGAALARGSVRWRNAV